MSADALLDRLDGVRQVGPGRYVAKCPAHEDRRASLAITEKPDGVLLVHCFAGCAVAEIVDAVGFNVSNLFPPREPGERGLLRSGKPQRRRWSASQVLPAVSLELLEILIVLQAVLKRGSVTVSERTRLVRSVARVQAAEGATRD
ncbi:hypothetical protein AWB67_00973 [Caballeronia terrestris]|uniref:DNA primase n=1 Tax=Caballeronia terrestris TaxID=1226301 RepID=A0A158FZ91_9BURK|nr:hypothetical protein [Caballeronia terrestris]SAL24957.1 hypothetical protein AWB67_00973 [Caballeronia terrestris]